MAQTFVNVVIPFEPEYSPDVNLALRRLTDPRCGNLPTDDIEKKLTDIGVVHFMSITVIDPVCPAESDRSSLAQVRPRPRDRSHLLIEMSVDVGTAEALSRLVENFGGELLDILAAAQETCDRARLEKYLLKHRVVIKDSWGSLLRRSALGQVFSGSPGQSVWRILHEKELARRLGDLIARNRRQIDWSGSSPRQRLESLRNQLWDWEEDTWKWAFVPEAAPCLAADPQNKWRANLAISNTRLWKAGRVALNKLLWPLYLPFVLVVLATWRSHGTIRELVWTADVAVGALAGLLAALATVGGPVRPWLRLAFVPVAILGFTRLVEFAWTASVFIGLFGGFVAAFFAVAFRQLRHLENTDPVEDRTPLSSRVAELMKVENFCAQNHLASVSRLKPGLLRRLTLRIAFIVVGTARFFGAPGYLGKNGVIHFARWMRLPGTDQLLFCSNYDGTWESYVGDFIADAPSGVTGIWSNCVGFPRTTGLALGGAEDRDRLVRWARRQQHPTTFWYSAYRDLTAERIRINAAIRQGFASAESDADARDWLALFGSPPGPPEGLSAPLPSQSLRASAPRPLEALQIPQIPTLVFGGLSSMRFGEFHVVEFGKSADEETCRDWLRAVAADAAYGFTLPGQKSAIAIALSASGLKRLGVPDDALATFPVAFQQGMWPEWRARALGDVEKNAPGGWAWGGSEDRPVHALLLVYGREQADVEGTWKKLGGHKALGSVYSRSFLDLPEEGPTREPFGFTDGVSQPVIRGTPKAKRHHTPNDWIAPGEIVLGYPDNLGLVPPSPSVSDEHDPRHALPDAGPDPFRRRPEFSRYEGRGRRDLGANGTFLVVRQLQQDVKKFEAWQDAVVDQVAKDAVIADDRKRTAIVWGPPGLDAAGSPLPRPRVANTVPFNRGRAKDAIAAKLIGRWKDGTSLVRNPLMPGGDRSPPAGPDNDFLLGAEDPRALACPFGAHVRRANPRDTRYPGSKEEIATINRHRMLRVGRVYKEDPGDREKSDRGLLFMCLNADIERQFEFVQRTWLLNPNLHGLENEVDPILGQGQRILTVPTPTGAVRLEMSESFVTVRGGGYFFLPGRAVLQYLTAERPAP